MSVQIDLTKTSKASVRKIVSDRRDVSDKSPLRFYTIESISENRSYTPEGYLLCEGATLSRTGSMLYKADEVPVTAGSDGLVTVVRYDEDVFKPEAVASANGKSVCNNHPAEGQDITPENWRALEVGVILHPRRGTGEKHDCLVADLLIKDEKAIKLIESGKVQLSCGYDADYEEIKPGYARQFGIIINHVAIVENGRCGPRCAIMDEDTLKLKSPSGTGNEKMTGDINSALANLSAALNKSNLTRDNGSMADEQEILTLALEGLNNRLADLERRLPVRDRRRRDDDDDDDDRRSRDRRHHNDRYSRDDDDDDWRSRDRRDARRRDDDDDDDDRRSRDDDDDRRSRDRRDVRRRDDDDDDRRSRDRRDVRRDDDDDAHFTDKRTRNNELEVEAGEKNKDRVHKAKDSALLEDSWKETISLAECLLPGVQAPKFTRDAKPGDTLTALCEFRKSVLSATFTKPEGRALILELNRGEAPDFKGMSCAAARSLFRDCAIIAKRTNNTSRVTADTTTFGLVKVNNPVVGNPAEYNKWAQAHWATHYGEDAKKTH